MVIEKFLALSMIALGLAASAADPLQPQAARPARGGRRRVRWLRQHLPPRGSAGSPRAPRPASEEKS
jgi:hypothetical protein